jgi:D-alanine-D-alanine ligase-like ATP-grasp enzyme
VRAFELEYGSLDFIVDKNDKLIFLEVNPTGA